MLDPSKLKKTFADDKSILAPMKEYMHFFYPLTEDKTIDCFKLKQIADNNLKCI